METTLIQTKLQPPENLASFIKRPYLTQRLQQNPQRHLTLVSAPAGFGKTSLITAWLTQQNTNHAWISLDQFDDDMAIFLRYLTIAIRRIFPKACPQLSQILLAPDLPTTETLTTIVVNELSQLPKPILLVLDDYHSIHNKNILQLVGRILLHVKNRLHLVIISRVDPLLPLPRLRLQQQMVEIRRQDLRFSDEEAQQFLQTAVSTRLNSDQMIQLNHQVEGWVAGLRLASLSLQNSNPTAPLPLDSAKETQSHIANYLFLEVLAQQPNDVQEFLLQT